MSRRASPPPAGGEAVPVSEAPAASWLPDPPEVIVGVDQTGAARRGGRAARPLPVAAVVTGARPRLIATLAGRPWRWDGLHPDRLRDAALPLGRTLVLIDAVLGLPQAAWARRASPGGRVGLARLAVDAAAFEHGGKRFGRPVAEAFLAGFDPGRVADHRAVDRLAGAWPVFRTRPFQRDVGTGSVRVWSDLAEGLEAWRLWPYDDPGPGPWLAEGWPSQAWRALGEGTRRPGAVVEVLRAAWPELVLDPDDAEALRASPDQADAAVLAVWGARARGGLPDPAALPEAARVEGWIAGIAPPGSASDESPPRTP